MSNESRIAGVLFKAVRLIQDERGWTAYPGQAADPEFPSFAQLNISYTHPGVVRAWHCHPDPELAQSDAVFAIKGRGRIGLFDDRPESPTRGAVDSVVVGDETNPRLCVVIPPGVWHGIQALTELYVAYVVSAPYAPDRNELRRPPDDPAIPFSWEIRGW